MPSFIRSLMCALATTAYVDYLALLRRTRRAHWRFAAPVSALQRQDAPTHHPSEGGRRDL